VCNSVLEQCVVQAGKAVCQFGASCTTPTNTPAPTAVPVAFPGECGKLCASDLCSANEFCQQTATSYRCTSNPEYCAYQSNAGRCGQGGTINVCGNDDTSVCPFGKVCKATPGLIGYYYCKSGESSCPVNQNISCGATTSNATANCTCKNSANVLSGLNSMSTGQLCCGWVVGLACMSSDPAAAPTPTTIVLPTSGPGTPPVGQQPGAGLGENIEGDLDVLEGPTNETFDKLNPLNRSAFKGQLSTPGNILTRGLNFAFPIGGVILFVMLVWSGFEILTKAADKNAITAGKQRATAAVVGFFLLFCSYWIMQIIEYIFGIHIL